jgi:HSP20 family protein
MELKKIAPWNWFRDEAESSPAPRSRDPFEALRAEMERAFGESFGRFGSELALPRASLLRPNVDIVEGKKSYKVQAELPGMDRDDISVDVEGRRLTIRGEKRRESEDEKEGYHCVERSYGSVQRVLTLPDDADGDSVDAKFKNGVLTLKIPKRTPKASSGSRVEIAEG